jgi:hypothetical protein
VGAPFTLKNTVERTMQELRAQEQRLSGRMAEVGSWSCSTEPRFTNKTSTSAKRLKCALTDPRCERVGGR